MVLKKVYRGQGQQRKARDSCVSTCRITTKGAPQGEVPCGACLSVRMLFRSVEESLDRHRLTRSEASGLHADRPRLDGEESCAAASLSDGRGDKAAFLIPVERHAEVALGVAVGVARKRCLNHLPAGEREAEVLLEHGEEHALDDHDGSERIAGKADERRAAEAADAKTEPEGEAREITREYFDEVLSRVLEGDYGVCSLESWDKVTYYHYRPLLSCSYARILSAENNPVEQVVDMIRESSRVYPRPVAIGVFEEPPFGIEAEELQEMLKMIAQDPEKQDIRFTTSSIGTVFLYSNKYLEDGYAEFLAEEQDVGAVMNP